MSTVEAMAARMVCVGFDGFLVNDELRALIERGVSSVILFSRNYQNPQQLRDLCADIKALADRPILIGVDQEGGRVQRFRGADGSGGGGFSTIPSMRELGRLNDADRVREIGATLARELRAVGIDLNFAPVLDVDSNPANPVIGERSFSSDPALVEWLGCAMIEGLQGRDEDRREPASGVAACGKHFPGHGDTFVDSHLDLPRLPHGMDRLERIELPPFRAAIKAGVAAIMTSHVLFEAIDPARPATMSRPVIDGLLRGQLGFDRVVFSDDLEMKAVLDNYGIAETVTQAAIAGVDVMCVCSRHDLQHLAIEALINAIVNGSLDQRQVIGSNRRLDTLMDGFVS